MHVKSKQKYKGCTDQRVGRKPQPQYFGVANEIDKKAVEHQCESARGNNNKNGSNGLTEQRQAAYPNHNFLVWPKDNSDYT